MKPSVFSGVATALYTPFTPSDKEIDYDALDRLIDRQIDAGISAIVVLGTTGESVTLNEEERNEIISHTLNRVHKRIPVIVGTGGNCTDTVILRSKKAENLGANALLVVTPYYNKCNDSGLIKHYTAIAQACNLPIIVYNVPSRTAFNVKPELYAELAKIDNICGIKEANCSKEQLQSVSEYVGDLLPLYCGDDKKFLESLEVGAKGIISVTSNIIPDKIIDNYLDFQYFYKFSDNLDEINNALFSDVNPIPLKYAVRLLYGEGYGLRLPLTETDYITQKQIETALINIGAL